MEVQSPEPPRALSTSNVTPAPNWVAIFDCTTSNLSALLADSVLVWLGGLVSTILQAYWQIIQQKGLLTAWQPIDTQIGPGSILTAFWACTITLNAYATLVIARRLWLFSQVDNKIATPHSSLRFVGRVITESGLLYLVITITHLVAWFTPSAYMISVVSNVVSVDKSESF
ncbi:hypothetical protein Clacol_001742 [Clathrus columnatus]|uniref:Uncharacterized protein n=1 Tax=Clathrus columnatus TaxID=1419009 RepID=A0AAV5A6K4_9AGAM|nr:hypothetical protein Clacol_001742 [Clathrus columnatus]